MTIVPKNHEGVGKAVEELAGLLSKFLGPGFEQAGEIVGDQVRLFRLKRELKLLRRAEQIVKDSGFNPKAVKMRALFPLLDSAVLEDDEEMMERWAQLLASAADPNSETKSDESFIEILKQLAPSHAFALDMFYDQVLRDQLSADKWQEEGYVLSNFMEFLRHDISQSDVAIENLFRLNLVAYPTVKLGVANGQIVRVQVPSSNIFVPDEARTRFRYCLRVWQDNQNAHIPSTKELGLKCLLD